MPWQDSDLLVRESLDADAADGVLEAVHDCFERLFREAPVPRPGGAWLAEFETALAEVAANIVRHASPPPPAGPARIHLDLELFADRVEAAFVDNGREARLPVETGFPAADEESGRGLWIIQAAVDAVTYERAPQGLNSWRLVKALPSEPAA